MPSPPPHSISDPITSPVPGNVHCPAASRSSTWCWGALQLPGATAPGPEGPTACAGANPVVRRSTRICHDARARKAARVPTPGARPGRRAANIEQAPQHVSPPPPPRDTPVLPWAPAWPPGPHLRWQTCKRSAQDAAEAAQGFQSPPHGATPACGRATWLQCAERARC